VSDRDHLSEERSTRNDPGEPAPKAPPEVKGDLLRLSRLTERSRHDPGLNSQRIRLIESLSQRMAPDQSPVLRGMLLNDLGQAYTDWSDGERATSL